MGNQVFDRAIVLGASMAGLLAARVLAETYAEVVVVDRDTLSGVRDVRRGVPQGRHAHSLHGRGQEIIEELFPGLTAELITAGVPTGDLGQMHWYMNGELLLPARTGLTSVTAPRPLLEAHVRARVAALPNVSFRERYDIVGLTMSPDASRVTHARIQHRAPDSAEEAIEADLVVDASGRGSRAPSWLAAAGYPEVPQESVRIDLAYTSQVYKMINDPFPTLQSINPVATPSHPRGAFFGRIGDGLRILSLTGVLGDHPPTDQAGFLAFVRSLPVPDACIYEAVRDAEPVDAPVTFRFPASVRRRYERLSRFPERLLVMGDAACTFNPVYGQGMIVSALEAMLLRRHLSDGVPRPLPFFADVAQIINAPWDVAAGGDLAFAGARGRRTTKVRVGNAYMARVQRAMTRDPGLTAAFLRVAGLVDPPQALMRPRVVWRVLRSRSHDNQR
jgi:2-polyprenyl-6-methoxyphenol hydroxylase-like FAD-dependent oxidoreductase